MKMIVKFNNVMWFKKTFMCDKKVLETREGNQSRVQ